MNDVVAVSPDVQRRWTMGFCRIYSRFLHKPGIAHLVERLVRNELLLITLTFPQLFLSALS